MTRPRGDHGLGVTQPQGDTSVGLVGPVPRSGSFSMPSCGGHPAAAQPPGSMGSCWLGAGAKPSLCGQRGGCHSPGVPRCDSVHKPPSWGGGGACGGCRGQAAPGRSQAPERGRQDGTPGDPPPHLFPPPQGICPCLSLLVGSLYPRVRSSSPCSPRSRGWPPPACYRRLPGSPGGDTQPRMPHACAPGPLRPVKFKAIPPGGCSKALSG